MIWQYRTQNTPVVFWHGSLDLEVAKDGGVVVASTRKSDDPFKAEATFWMAKLNQSDGTAVWTIEFPQRPPQSHFLKKVAMLPDGDLVAVGYNARSRGRSLVVARFGGSNGRLIWDKDIHGDSHEALEPTGLLVDPGGDVLVGASSWNGSATSPLYDSWVIKLSSADGRDMWTKRDAGVPAPYNAGQICSMRKLLPGVVGMFLSAGSFWNGKNADVRVDWLSASDGSVRRSLIYDGAAGDHDLFRDATATPDGEIAVALSSSTCPAWIKPLKDLRYRLSGGGDWRSIHSETNNLDDADPYNYESVLWRSLPVGINSASAP
jgi:hypothetical protein